MQGTERRHPGAPGKFTPMPVRPQALPDQQNRDSRFGADFSGIPAYSRLDTERADFHAKYRSGPVRDDKKIRIDAVADIVSASFPASPTRINAYISDSSVKSIEWHLVAPDGSVVKGSRLSTNAGDPDALSKPFMLAKSHFVDFGKFHLHCTGNDAQGNPRVYGVRDFNVVDAPMATDVWRHGRQGAMIFRQYEAFSPPGMRPWVNVKFAFLPSESVACDDVLFIQTAQPMTLEGVPLLHRVSQEIAARATDGGWAVDQLEENVSPYYTVQKDPISGVQEPKSAMGTKGHGGKVPGEASIIDQPDAPHDMMVHFESCAVCRTGKNRGQVFGCTTWGFVAESGRITLMPRDYTEQASGEFRAATASWNLWVAGRPGGETAP